MNEKHLENAFIVFTCMILAVGLICIGLGRGGLMP